MKYYPIIREDYCKNCGICKNFCNQGVFEIDNKNKIFVNSPEKCINCKLCEMRCPDLAIYLEEVK